MNQPNSKIILKTTAIRRCYIFLHKCMSPDSTYSILMDINIIICKYVCTLHIMLCQLRVTFFARLKKYYLVYFRKKESNRTWVHILTNHRGSNFQDGKILEGWNYVEMCVLKRCAALLLLPHFCKNPVWKITDNNIAQAARFVYKNPSDGSCPLLYFL